MYALMMVRRFEYSIFFTIRICHILWIIFSNTALCATFMSFNDLHNYSLYALNRFESNCYTNIGYYRSKISCATVTVRITIVTEANSLQTKPSNSATKHRTLHNNITHNINRSFFVVDHDDDDENVVVRHNECFQRFRSTFHSVVYNTECMHYIVVIQNCRRFVCTTRNEWVVLQWVGNIL